MYSISLSLIVSGICWNLLPLALELSELLSKAILIFSVGGVAHELVRDADDNPVDFPAFDIGEGRRTCSGAALDFYYDLKSIA